jgi:hypothetical protein
MPRKKSKHYINNKDFYNALKEYKRKCTVIEHEWEAHNLEDKVDLLDQGLSEKKALKELPDIPYPRLPEYIGECFFNIANRLASRPNFYGYSFKDDMIADAYEVCVLRVRSFDPEKSTNPFSYFTQTVWFAFLQRIRTEKKQADIKSELVMNSDVFNYLDSTQHDHDDRDYVNSYVQFLKENLNHVESDAEREQPEVIKKTTKAYQKSLTVKDTGLDSTKDYMADIEKEEYDE